VAAPTVKDQFENAVNDFEAGAATNRSFFWVSDRVNCLWDTGII
jgi:hypothetical protein